MIKVKSGEDWTFSKLEQIYEEIENIALPMGYDYYTNQIEVITAEQMVDCYSSVGMPLMYNHWSFGKQFTKNYEDYKKGRQGLAYEIVINSDPCIVYIMEQNTMLMQTLVIAHAGIGHNHFFKNNNLFLEWTDPSNIIDYLDFAKTFVAKCEEKYGVDVVEKYLTAAHSLMHCGGVFKYPRKEKLSFKKEMQRKIDRALDEESNFNDLWRTLPRDLGKELAGRSPDSIRKQRLGLPEENILYFIEQNSPKLTAWQREILRIVRNIAQYFYPQMQDKVMNEGCATWTHHTILNKLYEKGVLDDGAMMEFIKSHTGVVYQPDAGSEYYSGINPYSLGFAMMEDIVRICNEPTTEDRQWFPKIAGCKDSMNVLKDSWANYRDESFIRQFLSPKVMRDFKFFQIKNDTVKDHYNVEFIHNEHGFRNMRTELANSYLMENYVPNVEIVDADLDGDRTLELQYVLHKNMKLAYSDQLLVMKNIANLWGYPVRLRIVNTDNVFVTSDKVNPEIGFNTSLYNE